MGDNVIDIGAAVLSGGLSLPFTESIKQQKIATKEAGKARKAQQRIQNIKAARERRSQVRQSIIAQSQIEAAGAATGATGSSSVSQGQSSIQSQLASNISFLDQVSELTQQSSIFTQKAAKATGRAQTASAVSGLVIQGASLFAGKGA